MAIISATLVLVILHSVGLIHLPTSLIDKLAILFEVEIVTLLGVIVHELTKTIRGA